MTILRVDVASLTLTGPTGTIPCTIGRSGACPAAAKREGDGMTPIGTWPIRTAMFRADRGTTPPIGMKLPWRWIGESDGWSDGSDDPAYNRPVRHPHPHSAERLIRDDGLYDIIVTLGHNDSPPVPDAGSAIFLHCANGAKPTEGCVAIARAALETLLPHLAPGDSITIG